MHLNLPASLLTLEFGFPKHVVPMCITRLQRWLKVLLQCGQLNLILNFASFVLVQGEESSLSLASVVWLSIIEITTFCLECSWLMPVETFRAVLVLGPLKKSFWAVLVLGPLKKSSSLHLFATFPLFFGGSFLCSSNSFSIDGLSSSDISISVPCDDFLSVTRWRTNALKRNDNKNSYCIVDGWRKFSSL